MQFRKKPKLTILAIGLIMLGIYPITQGGINLYEGGLSESSAPNELEDNLGESVTVDLIAYTSTDPPYEKMSLTFETLVIFEGDVINITAKAQDVKTDVKSIAIFFSNNNFNFSKSTFEDIRQSVILSNEYNQLIELNPSTDPAFEITRPIFFPATKDNITIQTVLLRGNGVQVMEKQVMDVKIYPKTDLLQANTNKAILNQIEEQEKSNKLFLGFNFIGLAGILLLLGTDILLRIHFKN